MPRNLKICYRAGVGEILEKKSRFIATVASVKTEEEASSFIEKVKKDNRDVSNVFSNYKKIIKFS